MQTNADIIHLKPGQKVLVQAPYKVLPPLSGGPGGHWSLLRKAESRLYANEEGSHAYTSVVPNEGDDVLLSSMWEQAWTAADNFIENPHHDAVARETARRVAAAMAVLSFGTEFLLK